MNDINIMWEEFRENLIKNNLEICMYFWGGKNIFFMQKYFKTLFDNIYNIEYKSYENIDMNTGIIKLYQKDYMKYFTINFIINDDIINFAWPIHLKKIYLLCKFKKYHGKNCIINYEEDLKNDYIKNVELSIDKLCNILDTNINCPITIYQINHSSTMTKLYDNNSVDGFLDPITGEIYILGEDKNSLHEIIHAITYHWNGWPSEIVHEGLAEAFKKPINYDLFINEIYNDSFSLEYILKKEDFVDSTMYASVGLFFRFLYETKGVKILKQIYYLCTNDNLINVCENLYEKDFSHIENEWIVWMNQFLKLNKFN